MKYVCEDKIDTWLGKMVEFKDESDCTTKLEKDFYKKVFQKAQQEDDPEDNLLLYDEHVTSITLCYDLTEI